MKYLKRKYFFTLMIVCLVSCNSVNHNKKNKEFNYIETIQQIDDLIYKYTTFKDTAYLLEALFVVDTTLKYSEPYQHVLDKKIWIYRCLKRYDEAIDILKSNNDNNLYDSPFGVNYYLKTFEILKYNTINDTFNRNNSIRQLIFDMELSFDGYNNIHIDSNELKRLGVIPSVSPKDYTALIDYYTIRLLLEDRDILLKEAEKISIDNDFEDKDLKNSLMSFIKNSNPQKFYE